MTKEEDYKDYSDIKKIESNVQLSDKQKDEKKHDLSVETKQVNQRYLFSYLIISGVTFFTFLFLNGKAELKRKGFR